MPGGVILLLGSRAISLVRPCRAKCKAVRKEIVGAFAGSREIFVGRGFSRDVKLNREGL
jgi:hypothetical protein